MIPVMNITGRPVAASVPADPYASVLSASRFLIAKKALEIQASTGVAIVQQLLDPSVGRSVDFRA